MLAESRSGWYPHPSTIKKIGMRETSKKKYIKIRSGLLNTIISDRNKTIKTLPKYSFRFAKN